MLEESITIPMPTARSSNLAELEARFESTFKMQLLLPCVTYVVTLVVNLIATHLYRPPVTLSHLVAYSYFVVSAILWSVVFYVPWWRKHLFIRWSTYENNLVFLSAPFFPYLDFWKFFRKDTRRTLNTRYQEMLTQMDDTSQESYAGAIQNGYYLQRCRCSLLLGSSLLFSLLLLSSHDIFRKGMGLIVGLCGTVFVLYRQNRYVAQRQELLEFSHYQDWLDCGHPLCFWVRVN
jgi:hypothetical protein